MSSRIWPQPKPGRIAAGGDRVAVWVYSPEPNKWQCQAISVHIPLQTRERSIFQSQAAGKRVRREVSDPDDFSGTATNCETEIDFENTCRVPGNLRGGFTGLGNQIYKRQTPMNILSF